MSQNDELLHYIFEQRVPDAAFEAQVDSSRTFRTFVETYRDKIRKKLRSIGDEERLEDLMCELEVAHWLLQDKRFTIEYEKYAATKGRGADFTVTFRANQVFNLEVTHLRRSKKLPLGDRLANMLADKVGQSSPGMANAIVIVTDEPFGDDHVKLAINRLKTMANQKKEDYFARHGYQTAGDFLKKLMQLSAVVRKRRSGGVWQNPAAKHPLPKEVIQYLSNP
jgi:hypothetical protein